MGFCVSLFQSAYGARKDLSLHQNEIKLWLQNLPLPYTTQTSLLLYIWQRLPAPASWLVQRGN